MKLSCCVFTQETQIDMAAVTSGLITIVNTGKTIVSYFGNVTTCLVNL